MYGPGLGNSAIKEKASLTKVEKTKFSCGLFSPLLQCCLDLS